MFRTSVDNNCLLSLLSEPDMEFVQNFTPPDFQAKNFTPSISPNFNSFSKKKHKKWVKMEKFTPLAKILHCRRQWRHGQIPTLFVCVDSKHLLTFDQLTCTLARSSQQDWKGTLDCWGTCRTYGPSLFWALGGRGGQGQEPDRGESSLHRHRPGPGKRGSKSAGPSVHSCQQTTC